MRILVQRVDEASVNVSGKVVGRIQKGFLLFVGVESGDTSASAEYLADKVGHLRIFEDEQGKMNLSLKDVNGEILAISQFTLAADTTHGNRPGFSTAAVPSAAEPIYEHFVSRLRQLEYHVETGIFQAEMKVSLINNGPATFILEKRG